MPPPDLQPEELSTRKMVWITEIGVGSWCPTPDGSGPATAVVLHFKVSDGKDEVEMALRLKTPRAVDELIAMLERHRDDVWPEDTR